MATERNFDLHDGKSGAAITVRITPRSNQNQIKAILKDGTIHVGVKTPKKGQDINLVLIDFLSQILEIDKGAIEIIGGQQGMDKIVSILNIDAETVQDRIYNYQDPTENA